MTSPLKILTEEDCLNNLHQEEQKTVESARQDLPLSVQRENAAGCIVWEGLLEMIRQGETITMDVNSVVRLWDKNPLS
jgi:hypothetical protein